jgi:hypothetical protein
MLNTTHIRVVYLPALNKKYEDKLYDAIIFNAVLYKPEFQRSAYKVLVG